MRKDKEIAYNLRKEGESYRGISRKLKIPMGTLSGWFANEEWSKGVKEKLTKSAATESRARMKELGKVRGQNLKRIYEEARTEAIAELETLKYNPLFIAGLMLYWGEGDKLSKGNVSLTNTDPKMLKLYVAFLTRVCGVPVERIRGHILLYPDLDDWLCRVYWAQETGLSKGNFGKSTVIQGKHKTRKLSFGICVLNVASSYLKVKILEWMKTLPGELMDERYYANMGQ
jgi:hypothetical protein